MKKLNHLNIVKAVNLPQELNTLASSPILAMEYCSLGDLRQVSFFSSLNLVHEHTIFIEFFFRYLVNLSIVVA